MQSGGSERQQWSTVAQQIRGAAGTRPEFSTILSSPRASPFQERLVLENKLKWGQEWPTRTYISFSLAVAYPTVQALVIPGSADRCPRSLPTEPQSDHRAATAGLVTPGCILWEKWGHAEEDLRVSALQGHAGDTPGPGMPTSG